MKTTNNLRPFSLVELLVVVAVIAILAGLLLPALNSARQTAQQIKCTGSMKQTGTAAHLYAGQNDDWNMPSAFNTSDNGSTAAGGTRFTTNREFLELLHVKANHYGYWDRGFVCSSVPEAADPNFRDYKLATNAYGIVYRGGDRLPGDERLFRHLRSDDLHPEKSAETLRENPHSGNHARRDRQQRTPRSRSSKRMVGNS